MEADPIPLPAHQTTGPLSVEAALVQRRSVREYRPEALTLPEVGQLLWAAQGITQPEDHRTAPSAGATYPLEVLLLAGSVHGLGPGLYRYRPPEHALVPLLENDLRAKLAAAALGQSCVQDGAAALVITAVYERTTGKYGQRGLRYVHMEVGYTSENIHLQAAALGLGTVAVGAFHDERAQKILDLPDNERPLLIMPVGKPY